MARCAPSSTAGGAVACEPALNASRDARRLQRALGVLMARPTMPRAAERVGLDPDVLSRLAWVQSVGGPAPLLRLGLSGTAALPALPPLRLGRGPRSVRVESVGVVSPADAPGQAHRWLRTRNDSHTDGFGTLGAIVRERGGQGRVLALTAGHVVATDPATTVADGLTLHDDDLELNGRLRRWLPDFAKPGAGSDIDAAAAEIDADSLARLRAVRELWPRGVAQPSERGRVRLRTRGTTLAGTQIGFVSCWVRVGVAHRHLYFLQDALCYQLDDAVSEPGDSGAPVWDERDRLLALHVGSTPAGTAGNAMAIPIQRILNRWSLDLVAADDPVPATPLQVARDRVVPAAMATADQDAVEARDVLARTVWGEARGEPEQGMLAVAQVVMNRVRARRGYWGNTVVEVCRKPFQFSCWNANDPNLPAMLTVDLRQPQFARALRVAGDALSGTVADPSRGATHYHSRWMSPFPRWVRGRRHCAAIGNHLFYDNID